MSNSLFLFDNQSDTGTVTASSTAGATMPADNVQNEQRTKVWRSGAGTTSYLDITLASAYGADYVAVCDLNLSTAGTIRVQSWADAIAGASPGEDITVSPTLYVNTELESSVYGEGPYGVGLYGLNTPLTQPGSRNITIIPLSAATIDPYWRITFTDANTSYQQVGRLYIGTGTDFEYNLSYGWAAERVDRTVFRESIGGQSYRQQRGSRLRLRGSFAYIKDTERTAILKRVEEFGLSTPFIYSIYPESTNQGLTTTLYGRFDSTSVSGELYDANNFSFAVIEEL